MDCSGEVSVVWYVKWKKDNLATDFIRGMRENKTLKVKLKLLMVEKGASEGLDKILVE